MLVVVMTTSDVDEYPPVLLESGDDFATGPTTIVHTMRIMSTAGCARPGPLKSPFHDPNGGAICRIGGQLVASRRSEATLRVYLAWSQSTFEKPWREAAQRTRFSSAVTVA